MKTTIELPDEQMSALAELGKARNVSPDELVREVVGEYLRRRTRGSFKDDPAFGIWRNRQIDGVEYQRQLRAEWDREWDTPA